MEVHRKLMFLAGVITLLKTGNARLHCQTYNEKDVVCNPDSGDVILQRGLVSDNNKTTGITLRGCRITELDYEAFENDFYLKYIDLSENKLSRLRLGVLDGNVQVTYLNLSHNMLTSLPLGLFDQKINIDVLDLKGNRLNSLEVGIFDPLQKLAHLDLSSNALIGKNIDPDIFDQSRRIKFMDFSRNDMSDSHELLLHSFEQLDFLNLDRCLLSEVPAFAARSNLKTMKHLMLSTNAIRKLNNPLIFRDLDGLEILNLAENMIDEITDDVFVSLKNLKMIVLRRNRIKTLPDTLFRGQNRLVNVDLSHNFIEYVPVGVFSWTGVRNLNLSYNRFTYLEANFCLELRNFGVNLNKFYINDNPWQCGCLNDILKEMKKYRIGYNAAKFNGAKPVCVTNKTFSCKRQRADNAFYIQLYVNEIKK